MEKNQYEIESVNNEDIIEKEETGSITIEVPFNPQDVKVETRHSNIGDLIDLLEHNEIKLDTEFQRQMGLWNPTKQSRLIESLLLRLPIPAFYFDAKDSTKWRVIDGLQRLSTIKSYVIDQKFALVNLEFLTAFNGKKFDELPRDLQRRIKTFQITAYILEKGTPDLVKYTLFSRINGGMVLMPQEMRHALHQGIASELVSDLVRWEDSKDESGNIIKRQNSDGTEIKLTRTIDGEAFGLATEWKITTKRMEDRDFATRFVSFYLIPFHLYEPDLDSFMNKGMSAIKKLSKDEIKNLKSDFSKAMSAAREIFDNDAFRKRFNEEDNRKPINKALFEVFSVCFAKLSKKDLEKIVERKITFKKKFIDLHNEGNGEFVRSISSGTALKYNVEYRFQCIERIIRETLE